MLSQVQKRVNPPLACFGSTGTYVNQTEMNAWPSTTGNTKEETLPTHVKVVLIFGCHWVSIQSDPLLRIRTYVLVLLQTY